MACFPMFVDLTGKSCLVVGGGRIALRKVKTLLDFGADITVVAPQISTELSAIPGVTLLPRGYRSEDCADRVLAIAATNDRGLNRSVALDCKARNIPVNVIDSQEDSTFLFPAYTRQGDIVAAVSSGGSSPLITQKLKKQIEPLLTPTLVELNSLLGNLREEPRMHALDEAARKKIYADIYEITLFRGTVPADGEIQEMIANAL